MESWDGFYSSKNSEGYVRCLRKAIDGTSQLLIREDHSADHERIHAVKSILYAAIERAGLESERLVGVQRMLRELLVLTMVHCDGKPEDREQAMRILGRLTSFEQQEYR